MNIIAIDIGTSNCKAVIINNEGKVLKSFESSTKPIEPKPGWNEQNADVIFNASLKLLQQSFTFCKDENIGCVSFSAAMHSLLAVDKNGNPLMNMITWADLRGAEYAHQLKQRPIAKKLYQVTGVPIHAMSPLCKLIWMKHEAKTIFNKTYKFISIKEYIFFKLFGKYIVDYSIAAATGLFDEKNICWFDEALKITGIKKGQLSELVSIYHYETELIPSIKNKLKLKQNIPFVLGASDGALANIGCSIFNKKNIAVTVGTSGAARITSTKYSVDKKQRLFCYYITDELYILGGAVNNGGIVLQWLIEKILKQNFKNEKIFNQLLQAAMKIEPGANGLIFLPYILGERSPMWNENARGALIGLMAFHTQAYIIKAVVEGICFGIFDVIKAVEETSGAVETIDLSGGITKTKSWVQLMANITGKKIIINEGADASALGAAFVGMKAIGQLNNLNEAGTLLKKSSLVNPDLKQHNVYKKYFKVYQSLYALLKDKFKEIDTIISNG